MTLGERELHCRLEIEPAPCLVRLATDDGERPKPALVQRSPAERELQPRLVGLCEAPERRRAVGVAPLGGDCGEARDAVADQPIRAALPREPEAASVRRLRGVEPAALELEIAERMDGGRCAEHVVDRAGALSRLAEELPPAVDIADGLRLLTAEVKDAPEAGVVPELPVEVL